MAKTHNLTFAAFAAIALALSLAMAPALTNQAFAKITEEPVACENPVGQRPECKGGAHEQITENQNPSGKAPPGHNK